VINKLLAGGQRAVGLLKKFHMSGCPLGESSSDFGNLLAACRELQELEVQDSGIAIGTVFSVPNVGLKLKRFDISKNKLRAPEINGICDFLRKGKNNLSELILSHCDLNPQLIQSILSVSDVSPFGLLASHNGLGSEGARVVGDALSRSNSIDKLDLSDNNFGEEGLALIFEGLASNSTIISLDLSLNLHCDTATNKKLFNSFDLFCGSSCPIEVFRFRGADHGRLGKGVKHILTSLARNSTITELDISGHHFGDAGARALSRLLYKCQNLASLYYDDNYTTPLGLAAIANALSSARSLRDMPVPFLDVSKIMNDKSFVDNDGFLKDVLKKLEHELGAKTIIQQNEAAH